MTNHHPQEAFDEPPDGLADDSIEQKHFEIVRSKHVLKPEEHGLAIHELAAKCPAREAREFIRGVSEMRIQNAAAKPFDVSRLEDEVRDVVLQKQPQVQAVEYAPKSAAPQVPDYVSHSEGVTEIGKLTAEAIVKEYEETAKEIEAIGEVVKDMVKRCEQLTSSASDMLKDIKTTAQRYRKEGKRMFNEIESCSTTTDEVRRLCGSFRDRIATKTTERAT